MSVFRWRNLMWSEALGALDRMDRMHRQAFAPARSLAGQARWEPPVDMLETEQEVLIFVALPGVDPDRVLVTIEGEVLVLVGERVAPAELRTAVIHRLELPQGRFERRLPLPPGRYDAVRRSAGNGCLLITVHKAPSTGGRP